METNEWTHEKMSLKVQLNQRNPKKRGVTITNKKKQPFTNAVNGSSIDVIIVQKMATKRQIVGKFMENPTQS